MITDVVMPQLSGWKLADHLVPGCPGLKIHYVSGYAHNAGVRHGVLKKGIYFLPKPCTPLSLAGKVREVLDQPDGGRQSGDGEPQPNTRSFAKQGCQAQ